MRNKYLILVGFFLLKINLVYAIDYASPLDIPLTLSANFGELRSNHFHSGVDFKTQGRIGLVVKSVADGYVSRISVSPTGYGRALYIDHPDGTTTVYGHMDRFVGIIEDFVCDSQYVKNTFSINIYPPKDSLSIKKGEIIGYGGNTGSSGGPHLHFEIRDTETEEPLDPLPFYKEKVKDTRKPLIQAIMIYPQQGKGIVNGKIEKQLIKLIKDKSGQLIPNVSLKAWGEVGLGVKAYDYMDNTHNIYGVKNLDLWVNDTLVFSYEMDRFAFSETRYINSFIDWDEWVERKAFFMKSFIDPGNKLRNFKLKKDGIIEINEEKKYKIKYVLRDLHGNESNFIFHIDGKKQEIPDYKPRGTYYSFNRDNRIIADEIDLYIPKGSLYTDIYFTYSKKKNYSAFSSLFTLHKRIPLHSSCPLTIKIENDSFPDKDKYGIISLRGKSRIWIGGKYDDGKISANIRELGNFFVSVDSVPPKITEINPTNWSKTKKISFKINDNLSGISSWYASLDGNFILFEYDAKQSSLFCKFDEKRMKRGKQNLILWVEDACGNRKYYEKDIIW